MIESVQEEQCPSPSLEEICETYDLDSLQICYEEAKWWVEMQVRDVEFLASKSVSLLGFEGAYIAVLAATWGLFMSGQTLSVTIFMSFSVLLLLGSVVSLLLAQRVLPLNEGLSPRRLTEKFVNRPMKQTKYLNLHEMLGSIDQNAKVVDEKAAWLKIGIYLLGSSIFSSVIVMILLLLGG